MYPTRMRILGYLCCGALLLGCGGTDEGSSSQGSGTNGTAGSGGSGASGGSGGNGGSGGVAPAGCQPLPAPTGNVVEVGPAQVAELPGIVQGAQPGDTILLQDGTYPLNGAFIQIATPGVTLRSKSGNRDAVVLDGGWATNEIVYVSAPGVTVADVTIARAIHHPIHVTPGGTGSITDTMIYNVYVLDPGQQAIKINANGNQTLFADGGTVACSRIELTDDGRAHVQACYTGGIDAHRAQGWHVHDNTIVGFYCNDGNLSEHGIHFWTGSRDTIIERNVIVDCARGIGLGLGGMTDGRTYPDDPCPGVAFVGHYGGIVRNNFIYASIPGFDTGIMMDQACNPSVFHNTVASQNAPFSSIEWRFPGTNATIINNLVSHNLVERDGAQASLMGNIEQAPLSLFINASVGDLHLLPGASMAIDQGVMIGGNQATEDIDGDPRDGTPDVGADEVVK